MCHRCTANPECQLESSVLHTHVNLRIRVQKGGETGVDTEGADTEEEKGADTTGLNPLNPELRT